MEIVYIDPLELTHPIIKETFKKNTVSLFKGVGGFLNTFDVRTVTERRVIIIDIPIYIDGNIENVKRLIFLRALSEGNLKIVLFSDYTKIRYGFNRILLSPDLTIDKRTNLDRLHSEIKFIFKNESRKPEIEEPNSQKTPLLTFSEYLYVIDLMRGKTIKEISKASQKGIKGLYSHRRNILIKYNLKNITELHSALTYE